MKTKYWIGLLLVMSVSIFVMAFRMGISKGTLDTIPVMIDSERFFIAARTARHISDLHDMKSMVSQKANCHFKKIVKNAVDDWQSCKENEYCLKKISKGYYAQTDEKIADFMALNCAE